MVIGLLVALLLVVGCVETYCQSGPKYGTECHSGADVRENQRRQGREPPPEQEPPAWWRPTRGAPVRSARRPAPPAPSASTPSSAAPPAPSAPGP